MVDDEDVEDAIEQADVFKERVQMVILESTAGIESRRTAEVSMTSDSTGAVVSSSAAIEIEASSITTGTILSGTVSSGTLTSATTTKERAFGNSVNGKLKQKTEMVKMKIVYCLIHSYLSKKTSCKTRPLEL